jgi:hypothetical protein
MEQEQDEYGAILTTTQLHFKIWMILVCLSGSIGSGSDTEIEKAP